MPIVNMRIDLELQANTSYGVQFVCKNITREMVDESIETHICAFEDCGTELSLKKESDSYGKYHQKAGYRKMVMLKSAIQINLK